MSKLSSHLKIALESIKCFTDDGQLDVGELNYLLGIAKADGTIDAEEKRVLCNIISKAAESPLDNGTADRMQAILRELKK
tara:strand:- start:380 stop:619 length:240 start_codon:yes stop_codon:yes gene_type:complete